MATIALIGPDVALLEGVSQTLAAEGHRPRLAASLSEEVDGPPGETPLVAIVERAEASASPDAVKRAVKAGTALVLYRTSGGADTPLPPALRRATIAELTLPLERHRLVALIERVEERARTTGRGRKPTPSEQRAV